MGLKENVIVGRLIPAGTGAVMNRLRAIAAGRDQRNLAGVETPRITGAVPAAELAWRALTPGQEPIGSWPDCYPLKTRRLFRLPEDGQVAATPRMYAWYRTPEVPT